MFYNNHYQVKNYHNNGVKQVFVCTFHYPNKICLLLNNLYIFQEIKIFALSLETHKRAGHDTYNLLSDWQQGENPHIYYSGF